MLRLLERWCTCGTVERTEGPPSGAIPSEPSAVDTLGTTELEYSPPGNATLEAPAAVLISGYTPSDASESEVSDSMLVQQLFPDSGTPRAEGTVVGDQGAHAGHRAAGAADSPQADPGMGEHAGAHVRSACVPETNGEFQSDCRRGEELGFYPQ
eukprot:TRINITY_DN10567_c0_g1_i3.p1 TRINITY_DN10567_c0_g1~~TRINITY_DN10567_c0_g1_i3.p1  ORF type:complete len:179 (+),score=44.54 TRINITY_DN10567_c0_g1_i3:78-539(+)